MAKSTQDKIKECLTSEALCLITLNVGDGDSLVVRFPPAHSESKNGGAKKIIGAVIDCNNADKTIDALRKLKIDELAFVCATHPHADHTIGLKGVIQWCLQNNVKIHQFWDSGFRHVSKIHYDLIKLLNENSEIKFVRPTSGYETIINMVRVQVLSPSILLKNRYDTFGTNINNASIVIKLEYPTTDIAEPFGKKPTQKDLEEKNISGYNPLKQNTIILGGDAQFDAWARVTEEFPELVKTSNRGQLIDPDAMTYRPLRCQVLKVPHHMSKHGISLEVLETIKPGAALASCADKSKHGFPHQITVLAAEDIKKKVYYTGHHQADLRSGTLVTVVKGDGGKPKIFALGEPAASPAPLL
ncbi:MAG TPA: hypothetical protein PKW95_07720 [bacterium]|nr:hypothetical protein [bacterium]